MGHRNVQLLRKRNWNLWEHFRGELFSMIFTPFVSISLYYVDWAYHSDDAQLVWSSVCDYKYDILSVNDDYELWYFQVN